MATTQYTPTAASTHAAVIAALKAVNPGAMIDVPQLVRALTADHTCERHMQARRTLMALYEAEAGQLVATGCNPWSAEQALSRAQCAWVPADA